MSISPKAPKMGASSWRRPPEWTISLSARSGTWRSTDFLIRRGDSGDLTATTRNPGPHPCMRGAGALRDLRYPGERVPYPGGRTGSCPDSSLGLERGHGTEAQASVGDLSVRI